MSKTIGQLGCLFGTVVFGGVAFALWDVWRHAGWGQRQFMLGAASVTVVYLALTAVVALMIGPMLRRNNEPSYGDERNADWGRGNQPPVMVFQCGEQRQPRIDAYNPPPSGMFPADGPDRRIKIVGSR